MQLKLTYCECLVWSNHNQNLLGSFFFADEWAEAGDVLPWPLSSSHSPTAMAQQPPDKLKQLSLEGLQGDISISQHSSSAEVLLPVLFQPGRHKHQGSLFHQGISVCLGSTEA